MAFHNNGRIPSINGHVNYLAFCLLYILSLKSSIYLVCIYHFSIINTILSAISICHVSIIYLSIFEAIVVGENFRKSQVSEIKIHCGVV